MANKSNDVKRTRPPAIRKGGAKSLPFKIAIAGWIDLLGYGEMIAEAGYNPIAPSARIPINRLRAFHRVVAEHSTTAFRTLVLNDGAVAYRDLSLRGPGATIDFLCQAWDLFKAVEKSEANGGFPGARMVIAPGLRAKGSRRALDYTSGHLDSILARMRDDLISPEQAVREAAAIEKYFDVLPQLQANFAFTRAFVAEQSGSKYGLPGPSIYVDDLIFETGPPEWVSTAQPVDWTMAKYRLNARFHPVTGLNRPKRPIDQIGGVRDGLAIASILAQADDLRNDIHGMQRIR